MNSKLERIVPLSLVLLTSAFLPACASSQPRPVASYISALNAPSRESRNVVPMSDKEIDNQPAGATRKRTAESQTTVKRGKIQKEESEVTELVETDISTVVETSTSPTSDQDVQ
jgi:hypothetical protein